MGSRLSNKIFQRVTKPAHEQPARLKRGRPVGTKDSQPRQRQAPKESTLGTPFPTPTAHEVQTPNTMPTPENEEISIHNMNTGTIWHRPDATLMTSLRFFFPKL
jgi:hypothetical protein